MRTTTMKQITRGRKGNPLPKRRRVIGHIPTKDTLEAIAEIEAGKALEFDDVEDAIRWLNGKKPRRAPRRYRP